MPKFPSQNKVVTKGGTICEKVGIPQVQKVGLVRGTQRGSMHGAKVVTWHGGR